MDAPDVDVATIDVPSRRDVVARDSSDAGPTQCEPDDPMVGPPDPNLELGSITFNGVDFPLGVMAGDALPTRAMMWTRYDGAHPLVLRVVEINAADALIRVVFERDVTPAAGGFVHVDVSGLQPSRRYRFAFLEKQGARFVGRSRLGRVRTAPSANSCGVINFGGTSCNILGGAPFAALQHAATEKLDFFIHAGDHIYADGGTDATNLAEYRNKYEQYWQVDGLRDLHASAGLICTWDDHEVKNNWNAETIENTLAGRTQLAAATRTFFEHRAFRRHAVVPDRIYRSFKWGQTAEIFVLDCRGERKPSTRGGPRAEFISPEQLAWLQAGLRASTAVFKFVVTSKPITGRVAMDLARDDFWEGFPAQREALLRFVTDQDIKGLWFLSGDVHYGCICRVERAGPYSRLREVYMGPSGSGDPGIVDCDPGGQDDAIVRRLNYTKFRADPVSKMLDIWIVGVDNNVLCHKRFPA